MAYYRSDQGRIQVSVTGVTLDSISWDYASGGDPSVDAQHYSPGGMQPQVSLSGIATRADLTVRRAWSDVLIAQYLKLDNAVGSTAKVTYTPLRNSSTSAGTPVTFTGILKEVKRPDYDSGSSTVVNLELTISLNQSVS